MPSNAAYFCNQETTIDRVYSPAQRQALAGLCTMHPTVVGSANFAEQLPELADVEAIFSTWGMPALTVEQIRQLPKLKAVFYAAGSVQGFARPFLECGVKVLSAWCANAVPVAEFTLAQILLACKGYFRNTADCRNPETRHSGQTFTGRGVYGETVALLGAGQIGRKVIELLRPFTLNVVVVDPYLSAAEAETLGVRVVPLAEAFSRAYVVSNHLPDLPALRGMLKAEHFSRMRTDATFINTARGAEVVEAELIAVLQQRPDLTALLDVTWPEPPAADSLLYTLPNVQLSSHIAGSANDELQRMAAYMISEYQVWSEGRPLRYEVTHAMLETMA